MKVTVFLIVFGFLLIITPGNYAYSQNSEPIAPSTQVRYGGSTLFVEPDRGVCADGECKWTPEASWDIKLRVEVQNPTNDGIWFWIANLEGATIERFPSFCQEFDDTVRLHCQKENVSAGDVITGTLTVNPPEGTIRVCADYVLGVLENGQIEGGNDSDHLCKGVRTEPIIPPGTCFMANAVLGTALADDVQKLREFRDLYVLTTESGSNLMNTIHTYYYAISPTIVEWENESPLFKDVVRTAITPAITTYSLLDMVEPESEPEVVSYLIATTLLNLGIYFVAPAIVITQVGRKLKK